MVESCTGIVLFYAYTPNLQFAEKSDYCDYTYFPLQVMSEDHHRPPSLSNNAGGAIVNSTDL